VAAAPEKRVVPRPGGRGTAPHRQASPLPAGGTGMAGPAALPTMSLLPITDREFRQLRDFVYERFGINLTEQKRFLLVNRLQKMLKNNGFACFKDLYETLVREPSPAMLSELINRLSTNYSYFYRGQAHFDFFAGAILPELAEQSRQSGQRDIRVWAAGCSTGEEPYMLAILMREYFGPQYGDWDGGILATDISEKALGYAKQGTYPPERVKDMPLALRHKYFTTTDGGEMAVKERLKQDVTFRRFNLMNAAFPFKKRFQVIFCRNVMIYFDKSTRQRLIGKFYEMLEPGGYFFVGHSETLGRDQEMFQYVLPAVYRRR